MPGGEGPSEEKRGREVRIPLGPLVALNAQDREPEGEGGGIHKGAYRFQSGVWGILRIGLSGKGMIGEPPLVTYAETWNVEELPGGHGRTPPVWKNLIF